MNGSSVTAKIAGMESVASIRSVVCTQSSTSSNGVMNQRPRPGAPRSDRRDNRGQRHAFAIPIIILAQARSTS